MFFVTLNKLNHLPTSVPLTNNLCLLCVQLYPTESYLILSSHSVRWGHQPVVQHLFAQYPTTQYLIPDPLCALDEKTLWALRETQHLNKLPRMRETSPYVFHQATKCLSLTFSNPTLNHPIPNT